MLQFELYDINRYGNCTTPIYLKPSEIIGMYSVNIGNQALTALMLSNGNTIHVTDTIAVCLTAIGGGI